MVGAMDTVPVSIFSARCRRGGSGLTVSTSPRHDATVHILDGVLEHLSVSRYQLAGLLGTTHPHVYGWFKGSRCPGPAYWTRLMQLVFMQARGFHVFEMKSIDWNTGAVFWRDGVSSEVRQSLSRLPAAVLSGADGNSTRMLDANRVGNGSERVKSALYQPGKDSGPVY